LPATATFECDLNRSVSIQWLKDGRILHMKGDKYKVIETGGHHKLVINNLDWEDVGDYTAVTKTIKSTGSLTIEGKG
jgi:hypothetical protein